MGCATHISGKRQRDRFLAGVSWIPAPLRRAAAMIRPMPSRAWIVVLAAAALAGCGGGPTLSAGSAEDLHAQVAAARHAAAEGDGAAALAALNRMERKVGQREDGGSLADADADPLPRG